MNLENNLFETSANIGMLQAWLSSNDSISLQILDREEYVKKGKDFLEKQENQSYILYLAEDIKILELVDIVARLEKELNLEKYKGFELLVEKTKITLGLALKRGEITKEEIDEYISIYKVSEDTIFRFQNQKIRINKDTKRRTKGLGQVDLETKKDNLEHDFRQRFYTIFFSRGKQMLNDYLNVFTIFDYHNFINQVEDKDSDKEYWKEKELEGNVTFTADIEELYSEEKTIREAINIEHLKKLISEISNIDDKRTKKIILISVVNTVINELYKYPRQIVNGAEKPSHILKTKEMHCVGKTILGHLFLEELGIDHSAFLMNTHIALIVNILGDDYYFDAVNYSSINLIYVTNNKDFGKSEKLFLGKFQERVGIKANPEIGIQSSLWTNIGNQLYMKDKGLEGFYSIEQAISIFPENSAAWGTMGVFMEENNLPDIETALNCFEKSLDINPENIESWERRGKIIKNKKESLFSYAVIILLERDYKKAIQKFSALKIYHIVLGIKKNQDSLNEIINFIKEKEYDNAKKLAFKLRGTFIDK